MRNSRTIHHIATGLLILMAVVYCAAYTLELAHGSGWGFLRASAEAGMVGALADWFAVVALFRHPMGIPIPHTAVIPNRKNQIADSIADFVTKNFLTAENIVTKLKQVEIAGKLSQWLATRTNANAVAHRICQGLPRALDSLDDRDMQRLIRENVLGQARKVPLAPLAGKLLGVLSENDRDQELLDEALKLASQIVGENETLIRAKISEELSGIPDLPILSRAKELISRGIAEKVVEKVHGTLDDILQDKSHSVRAQFDEKVKQFIHDLNDSPEMAIKAENLKEGFLTNAAITEALDALWNSVKAELAADLSMEDSRIQAQLADTVQRIGTGMADDDAFRAKIDDWIQSGVLNLLKNHGHEVGNMIRDTINRWDGKEIAERLESQVGPDLQFIRLNGTIVGSLAGLLIYTVSLAIWH